MTEYTHAWASISRDGRYRHLLGRVWGDVDSSMQFIMLNPSTADGEIDDATIRRCVGFAKREGCGSLMVTNLFTLRATDPRELWKADDPVGPNAAMAIDNAMQNAAYHGAVVVAAWGAPANMTVVQRGHYVMERARVYDVKLHCLGRTKFGHPRHPLYLPADAPLENWP